ncbi:MAG: apolipoprotein N-acyltransferase, partial [Nitrospinota bacterium]
PYPASIVILLLLVIYMSLYIAGFSFCLALVRPRGMSLLLAPPLWTALELLRTHALSGFPWASLGYSQYLNLPILQISELTGFWGISFLMVSASAALAHLLLQGGRAKGWVALGVGGLLLVAHLWGWAQLRRYSSPPGEKGLRVSVLQGSVDQGLKWDEDFREETLRIYQELTLSASRGEGGVRPELIVWPETAAPFFFLREEGLRDRVLRLAREGGTHILLGAPSLDVRDGKPRLFNSAYLLGPDGRILSRYDKIHLVPYGEYVPLKRLMPFVKKLAWGAGDFSSGRQATVMSIPGGRFGVLICFEVIFPALVREFLMGGAEFLVNITNDAWFGRSAASYQHMAMASFRAVEGRVPIVRAANTGISGFIDAAGRIHEATPLFIRTAIAREIFPRKGPLTLYVRWGDWFAYLCALVSGTLLAFLGHGRWRP